MVIINIDRVIFVEIVIKIVGNILIKYVKIHVSHINRGQGLYCSRSCARQGSPTKKKERFAVYCKICNKKIYRRKSEIDKNINKIFFCSHKCWYNFIENIHYNYLDRTTKIYYEWRNSILDRDNYKCMVCGSTDKIHVHHIKRVADYPNLIFDIKNGISLCKKCHEKTYNREKIFEFILTLLLDLYYDNY